MAAMTILRRLSVFADDVDYSRIPRSHLPGTSNELIAFGLGSIAFWVALTVAAVHFKNHHVKNAPSEWPSRVVSLAHACASVMFTTYVLLDDPQGAVGAQATCLEQWAILVTVTYFFVDAVGMVFLGYFDPVFFIHHVASIGGYLIPMFSQRNAFDCVMGTWILEVSNPFLHTQWLCMETKGWRRTKLCQWSRFLFVVIFALFRFVIGPVAIHRLFVKGIPAHGVISVGFLVASLHYFFTLLGKLRRNEHWE